MPPSSCLQVGKDQEAQAFQATLDNDPTIGSNVDCTSYYVSMLLHAMLASLLRGAQLHCSVKACREQYGAAQVSALPAC